MGVRYVAQDIFRVAFFVVIFFVFLSVLVALAQVDFLDISVEADKIPDGFVWCSDYKGGFGGCYDGISYAYLIDQGINPHDYPLNKFDYLVLVESLK